jgi:hypothetical protein
MHGLKKASRLNNSLQHDLRTSHGLQMEIPRQGYNLQMPLEVATASASKKCPWAVMDTKYVPCGL